MPGLFDFEPQQSGLWGALATTWPARLAQGIYDAARLPGDVYAGRFNVTPDVPGQLSEADVERQRMHEGEIGKRATDLAGLAMLGATAAPAGALGSGPVRPGIRAYHGSPYDFERFDLSKIGTGEGAQAYGHGLYFADNPATAQSYRDALKAPGQAGRMYEVNINARPEQFLDWDRPLGQHTPEVQQAVRPIIEQAKKSFPRLEDRADLTGELRGQDLYRAYAGHRSYPDFASSGLNEAGIPGIKYLDQGSRLPALGAEKIQARIAELESELQNVRSTGHGIKSAIEIKDLTDAIGRLRSGAEFKPTSNYVVFDDKLIDILRKYGLAGMLGGGGAAAAGGLYGDIGKEASQ